MAFMTGRLAPVGRGFLDVDQVWSRVGYSHFTFFNTKYSAMQMAIVAPIMIG